MSVRVKIRMLSANIASEQTPELSGDAVPGLGMMKRLLIILCLPALLLLSSTE